MHELSIALSLLDVAAEALERQGGGHVTALHVKVGPLSGVVKEALVSAFELAREGSGFDDCRLIVKETSILLDCAVCGGTRPARSMQDICCDVCGEPSMNIVSGRELDLTAMEITDELADTLG